MKKPLPVFDVRVRLENLMSRQDLDVARRDALAVLLRQTPTAPTPQHEGALRESTAIPAPAEASASPVRLLSSLRALEEALAEARVGVSLQRVDRLDPEFARDWNTFVRLGNRWHQNVQVLASNADALPVEQFEALTLELATQAAEWAQHGDALAARWTVPPGELLALYVRQPHELPVPVSLVLPGHDTSGGGGNSSPAPAAVVHEPIPDTYRLVDRQDQVDRWVADWQPGQPWGLDLETTGLDPRRDTIRLLTVSTGAETVILDLATVDPRPVLDALRANPILGHYLQFDLGFLQSLGHLRGRVLDTWLAAKILTNGLTLPAGYHGLGACVQRELGQPLDKTLQKSCWGQALTEEQYRYAARDAAALPPLLDRLGQKLVDQGLQNVFTLECRCLPGLVWLADAGVPLDVGQWTALAEEAETDQVLLAAACDSLAPARPGILPGMDSGWNWSSPQDVQLAFRERGVMLSSTADAVLVALDDPLADALRDYRGAGTRASRYGRNWLALAQGVGDSARIYPRWKQIDTRAGRMSCAEPNCQNLPRDPRYRAAIQAPPGSVLVKADYSQIELRIAAAYSGDVRMLDAYRTGVDIHRLTAQQIMRVSEVGKQDRQVAKALNFGLLYGMGSRSLRVNARLGYGVDISQAEAAHYRAEWLQTYAGIRTWQQEQGTAGAVCWTRGGRRRVGVDTHTRRLNTPIQGTGADGLKEALALLWRRRAQAPTGARPIIACHDELVIECPASGAEAAAEWVRQAMVDGMQPLIPEVPVEVEVQIAPSWAG